MSKKPFIRQRLCIIRFYTLDEYILEWLECESYYLKVVWYKKNKYANFYFYTNVQYVLMSIFQSKIKTTILHPNYDRLNKYFAFHKFIFFSKIIDFYLEILLIISVVLLLYLTMFILNYLAKLIS